MVNSLRSKYLSGQNARSEAGPLVHSDSENENKGKQGYLGYLFIAVGVYYCSAIDKFGESDNGIVDPIVDGAGRTWRLVTSEYVEWMAGMVRKAFDSDQVSGADLSAAILKFYRVRDRLELELAKASGVVLPADDSDGDQRAPGGAGGGGVELAVVLGGAAGVGAGAADSKT